MPGKISLDDWRAIYRGSQLTLDPSCQRAIRESASAVSRILKTDIAVYGINTGFGKLASTRIDGPDLAKLQRNIVLSHAAGTGDPMPPCIARLMMALKLCSLTRPGIPI